MNDKVQGGFLAEAFDGLAAQEDSNWWFRSRNKIIIEDESSIGSIVIFDGSLKHGVEDIDPHLILEWQSSKDRISLFSNL